MYVLNFSNRRDSSIYFFGDALCIYFDFSYKRVSQVIDGASVQFVVQYMP